MNIVPKFIRRRISHRPNLVKIVDNISWLLFDKILRMGVGLLVGVWVARYLGPTQFGLMNFAMAFVGMFGVIAVLGFPSVVVRDLVRDPTRVHVTLGSAAALQTISGLLSFVLAIVGIVILRPEDSVVIQTVAILGATLLLKVFDVAVYWFESQIKSKYVIFVQAAAFLIFSVVKVILIYLGASLLSFVWAMLAEVLFGVLGVAIVFVRHGPGLHTLAVEKKRARQLLSDSWPLILSGFVLMIQARVDQLMLGQMAGELEVGLYSAALRVVEAVSFGAVMLQSTFTPNIIDAKKKSDKAYELKMIAFCRLNSFVALVFAVPICLYSRDIVGVLYGSEYKQSAPILMLMAMRIVLAHLGVVRGVYLLSENMLKYSAVSMFFSAVVNVLANFVLIPRYGGVGAVVASLLSFLCVTVLFDLLYPPTRKWAISMVFAFLTFFKIFDFGRSKLN